MGEAEALDEEIARLSAQLSELRVRRNLIVPIFALPNELLCRIIFEYASQSGYLFNLKWTRILLVCRRWNLVASRYQPLWSFIEIQSGRLFRKMTIQFERSGVGPLTIRCMMPDRDHARPLLLHTERLRDVEISGKANLVISLLIQLGEHPLPLLHSIKIEPFFVDELPPGQVVHMPAELLNGNAPSLRNLQLRDVSFDWELLHDLQNLTVEFSSLESIGRPTFPNLLSALQQSPRLQMLKLYFSSHHLEGSFRPVELPFLQFLEISGTPETCCALLSNMVVSPTASIHLLPRGISTGVDARQLLVPLHRHYCSKSAMAQRLIRFNSQGPYFMITSFRETTPPDTAFETGAYFSFNSHPPNEASRRKIMTKVLKALPLSSVTHLDARSASHLTDVSWKAAISLLPAIEAVYLRVDVATVNLGNALLQMMEPSTCSFPRLQRLHLDASFYPEETNLPQSVIDILHRVLQRYKELDALVQILEITRSWRIDNALYRGDVNMMSILPTLVRTFKLDGHVYTPA